MIGLDSNLILRHLVQDDPAQSARATAVFESRLSPANPGFVSTVVLVETVSVLKRTYGLEDAEIAAVVESLLQSNVLVIEHDQEVYDAMALFRDGRGDLADALIGTLAAAVGCTVTLTLDQGALRLPGFEAA